MFDFVSSMFSELLRRFEFEISRLQAEAEAAHSVLEYAEAKRKYEQIYRKYSDLKLEKSVEALQILTKVAYHALALEQYQDCLAAVRKVIDTGDVVGEKIQKLEIAFKIQYYRAQALHASGRTWEAEGSMLAAVNTARMRVDLVREVRSAYLRQDALLNVYQAEVGAVERDLQEAEETARAWDL